jgi:hypothetical protein
LESPASVKRDAPKPNPTATTIVHRTAFRSLAVSFADQGIVPKEQRPWIEQAAKSRQIPDP